MNIIEITVSPTGQSKVETKGFQGPACQHASRFLEQALGRRLQERLSDEFYQGQSHEQSNFHRS
jgi:hypothetical protein